MDLRARLHHARHEAAAAVWRVRTMGRVISSTGIARRATPAAAAMFAGEAARGRANVSLILRYHAKNTPHHTALVAPAGAHGATEDRAYSYFEVDQLIDRIAAGLASCGVRRNDAVMIALKNRPELVLLQAAIGRLGAAAVSVSWRSTPPEIEFIAANSGARALVFDATIEPTVTKAAPLLRGIDRSRMFAAGGQIPGFPAWDDLLRARAPYDEAAEEGAVVMYTSGTTGKPKGAVRKFQREAAAQVLSFIEQTPMVAGETHLVTCPLYHATAFAFTTITLMLGGTVLIPAEYRPEAFLETVERRRVTTTAVVPTMLHRLLELGPERLRRHDTSSLKMIISGGAPLSATLARDVLDALGERLYNFYGATETGFVTLAGPGDLRASPGTIGRAVPGLEIRLLDDAGREVPEGHVGELYARSALLVAGYHGDEAATRSSMRDGGFSVGDLARRDARGCYHIEGRKRDMIITGGVNVYPAEVEATLDAHPAVLESAVVGVADREWGERVRACVVLRPGAEASPEDLAAHCAERLAKAKVPRDFRVMERLPRNPTGKVLKRDLRDME